MNSTHKIKLLILWDILRTQTDENVALNTKEIIRELANRGVEESRKILVEDIETLNNNGYEILSYKKKYNYYYVVNHPFDTAEIVLLADIVKASKLSTTQKNTLSKKLANTLCLNQANRISKHIININPSKKGNTSLIYSVDSIEHSIDENKQISFLYYDYDANHKKVYRKNGERYIVSPIVMVWNKDNYYLLCLSENHDNITTYRLDKMDKVQVEKEKRKISEEYKLFNSEEYKRQVFSMFGGELKEVTLTFSGCMLSDIYDKFGEDIKIKKIGENTYSVDLQIQVSKTFFAWVVGTQGIVRIKSPQQTLDEFSQFVAKIKEEY